VSLCLDLENMYGITTKKGCQIQYHLTSKLTLKYYNYLCG